MIEKMKKITLLVSEADKERFIASLRKAGVLHIKQKKVEPSHEVTFTEDAIIKIERAVDILRPYAALKRHAKETEERTSVHADEDKVSELWEERLEICSELEELKRKLRWFRIWGKIEPEDLKKIQEKGSGIGLYRVSAEEYKKDIKDTRHAVIFKDGGYFYVAAVLAHDGTNASFKEVDTPAESPVLLEKQQKEREDRIKDVDAELGSAARGIKILQDKIKDLKKEKEFLGVKSRMNPEGMFCYLEGFCPDKKKGQMIDLAANNGAGYFIEDPEDPDNTPTLITNPKWIRIIDPVFTFMNTLPGYEEFDISPYFLVFFSLFFAMLIGDAGYGMLFLAITFLARRKMKNAPAEPFRLLYLLSFGTVLWGAVTGTWFGAERIAEIPFFKALIIQKLNGFNGANQDFIIYICFLIGAVQLTIAHILRFIRVINSPKAVAEAGWIAILWGMFFAAGTFVLGKTFPYQASWALAGGIITVLLFSKPEKGIIKGALATLADLPLSVISSFSDIVSYLRLFAVGYASVVVAQSFNDMALAGGISSAFGAMGSALILFFGHLLNIVLGGMAVIVHGVRLNMLEFSGHVGMQWSGKKYDPFREVNVK
ncbi:MAG: hypothetical protein ABIG55_01890 [Candidatus Omnitrophota bacterium]